MHGDGARVQRGRCRGPGQSAITVHGDGVRVIDLQLFSTLPALLFCWGILFFFPVLEKDFYWI